MSKVVSIIVFSRAEPIAKGSAKAGHPEPARSSVTPPAVADAGAKAQPFGDRQTA